MYNRPSSPRNGETKLQTSLSTPCEPAGQLPSAITIKREAECRRFKSEGSTTNNVHNPSVTLIDPHLDDSSCNYDGRSLNQQGNYYKVNYYSYTSMTIVLKLLVNRLNPNYPINLEEMPKSSHTEQVMRMHTLKAKMQKYKEFIDAAFGDNAIGKGEDQCIIDGCTIGTKVMKKSWEFQYISQELSHALCEHLCDKKYLEVLIQLFVNTDTTEMVRVCCGRFMQEILTECNRAYIIEHNYLKKIVTSAMMLRNNADQQRISLSIIECLFKDSENTTYKMITYGTIEYIIATCQRALTSSQLVLRQASLAFVNAVLYSSAESRKIIIEKKHHEWLYLLAQQNDEISRYYACLAVCILASFTDTESAALKCDTLGLVDPFLSTHIPIAFANKHFMHSPGRDNVWLRRLLSLLRSRCRQAKGIFGFHFVLETIIKKRQEKTPMFHEIGAIPYLKEIASSPDDQAAQFASDALTYIGEEVPHKLSRDVPCWNVTNVQCWVQKIGFDDYCEAFGTHKVDGDLLLLMTEQELEHDIKITSGLLRKKFMRELESLKIAADYSSVDETQLDQFLMSLSPELSAYTYQMLNSGLNRSLLPHLTDLWMEKVCGIQNIIHRHKLRQALEQGKHFDDIELSALSKQYDIFISYRRSNGNQLASLIKVMLTIQGYRVFIDVDRLHGGEFESSLLKKIQSAKHFLIVLTENSLDRLKDDDACQDWIHKELKCAFEHKKNIVPVMAEEFKFPLATEIPEDIRQIATFNGVNWVHEYQDACIGKIKRFLNEFEDGIPIPKSVSKTITKKEQAAKGKMTATTANTSSTTSPRNTTLKATKKYTSINGSTNGKLTPSNSTNGKLTPSNSTVTRPTRRIYAPNNNEFSLNHKN
uniref:ADP-ribosyl cyclase/cyclic ADP-ribose hydrolase n=1 Tax=Rhabditophanes sp. KR3021 TaxID=114890 RepID=A0AC35U9Q3_9BILA